MTKYEELDIENMTQADVRNVILRGDRISIEVEGVDGLLVRIIQKSLRGLKVRLYGSYVIHLNETFPENGMTVTRVERPIPEVELPTVPGYWLSTKYPHNVCPRVYRLRSSGQWYGTSGKVTVERMRELMPLTRLVPADEVERPEVDMDAAATALQKEWMTSRRDSYELDFKSVLRRVLEGDFDL